MSARVRQRQQAGGSSVEVETAQSSEQLRQQLEQKGGPSIFEQPVRWTHDFKASDGSTIQLVSYAEKLRSVPAKERVATADQTRDQLPIKPIDQVTYYPDIDAWVDAATGESLDTQDFLAIYYGQAAPVERLTSTASRMAAMAAPSENVRLPDDMRNPNHIAVLPFFVTNPDDVKSSKQYGVHWVPDKTLGKEFINMGIVKEMERGGEYRLRLYNRRLFDSKKLEPLASGAEAEWEKKVSIIDVVKGLKNKPNSQLQNEDVHNFIYYLRIDPPRRAVSRKVAQTGAEMNAQLDAILKKSSGMRPKQKNVLEADAVKKMQFAMEEMYKYRVSPSTARPEQEIELITDWFYSALKNDPRKRQFLKVYETESQKYRRMNYGLPFVLELEQIRDAISNAEEGVRLFRTQKPILDAKGQIVDLHLGQVAAAYRDTQQPALSMTSREKTAQEQKKEESETILRMCKTCEKMRCLDPTAKMPKSYEVTYKSPGAGDELKRLAVDRFGVVLLLPSGKRHHISWDGSWVETTDPKVGSVLVSYDEPDPDDPTNKTRLHFTDTDYVTVDDSAIKPSDLGIDSVVMKNGKRRVYVRNADRSRDYTIDTSEVVGYFYAPTLDDPDAEIPADQVSELTVKLYEWECGDPGTVHSGAYEQLRQLQAEYAAIQNARGQELRKQQLQEQMTQLRGELHALPGYDQEDENKEPTFAEDVLIPKTVSKKIAVENPDHLKRLIASDRVLRGDEKQLGLGPLGGGRNRFVAAASDEADEEDMADEEDDGSEDEVAGTEVGDLTFDREYVAAAEILPFEQQVVDPIDDYIDSMRQDLQAHTEARKALRERRIIGGPERVKADRMFAENVAEWGDFFGKLSSTPANDAYQRLMRESLVQPAVQELDRAGAKAPPDLKAQINSLGTSVPSIDFGALRTWLSYRLWKLNTMSEGKEETCPAGIKRGRGKCLGSSDEGPDPRAVYIQRIQKQLADLPRMEASWKQFIGGSTSEQKQQAQQQQQGAAANVPHTTEERRQIFVNAIQTVNNQRDLAAWLLRRRDLQIRKPMIEAQKKAGEENSTLLIEILKRHPLGAHLDQLTADLNQELAKLGAKYSKVSNATVRGALKTGNARSGKAKNQASFASVKHYGWYIDLDYLTPDNIPKIVEAMVQHRKAAGVKKPLDEEVVRSLLVREMVPSSMYRALVKMPTGMSDGALSAMLAREWATLGVKHELSPSDWHNLMASGSELRKGKYPILQLGVWWILPENVDAARKEAIAASIQAAPDLSLADKENALKVLNATLVGKLAPSVKKRKPQGEPLAVREEAAKEQKGEGQQAGESAKRQKTEEPPAVAAAAVAATEQQQKMELAKRAFLRAQWERSQSQARSEFGGSRGRMGSVRPTAIPTVPSFGGAGAASSSSATTSAAATARGVQKMDIGPSVAAPAAAPTAATLPTTQPTSSAAASSSSGGAAAAAVAIGEIRPTEPSAQPQPMQMSTKRARSHPHHRKESKEASKSGQAEKLHEYALEQWAGLFSSNPAPARHLRHFDQLPFTQADAANVLQNLEGNTSVAAHCVKSATASMFKALYVIAQQQSDGGRRELACSPAKFRKLWSRAMKTSTQKLLAEGGDNDTYDLAFLTEAMTDLDVSN